MKSLINIALFKEQMKRFWIIAALPLLCYVLLVVSPIYQTSQNYNANQQKVIKLLEVLAMKNEIMIIFGILVPLVTVFACFSYLFQVKSTTTMHSYPISKNQLWFTNVLSGYILMVIPLVIFCIILLNPVKWVRPEMFMDGERMRYYGSSVNLPVELFPNGIKNGAVINTFPVVAGFFFRTLLVFTLYYAVFLVAAFVSGNIAIYGAVSAALPFIPVGLCILSQIIAYYCCLGYNMNSSLIEDALVYTNPIALTTKLNYYDLVYNNIPRNVINIYPYFLSYILISAALFALSFMCNHIRPQERASDSIVFAPLKNVLIFLVSLFGMVMLGIFLLAIFKNVAVLYIGLAVGFIAAYFIAQMIAEKTLSVLNKARDLIKFGSVAIVLFLLVTITAEFDLTGYGKYSPKLQDVEGVYFSYPYMYIRGADNPSLKEKFFLPDSKVISDTIGIHREIVDRKNEFRDVFLHYIAMGGSKDKKYGLIRGQYFVFKLKDGKVVERYYALPQAFMDESGLSDILMTEDVILSSYQTFKSPEIISKIQLYFTKKPNESSVQIYIEDPEHIKSALEEIKKDIVVSSRDNQRAEIERLSQDSGNAPTYVQRDIVISGSTRLKDDDIERIYERYSEGGYQSYDYFNFEKADNTLVWLRKEGYID